MRKGCESDFFQGGEKTVADVFFHGYANYEKGLNKDYPKLTSCNTHRPDPLCGLPGSALVVSKKWRLRSSGVLRIQVITIAG